VRFTTFEPNFGSILVIGNSNVWFTRSVCLSDQGIKTLKHSWSLRGSQGRSRWSQLSHVWGAIVVLFIVLRPALKADWLWTLIEASILPIGKGSFGRGQIYLCLLRHKGATGFRVG